MCGHFYQHLEQFLLSIEHLDIEQFEDFHPTYNVLFLQNGGDALLCLEDEATIVKVSVICSQTF